MRVEVATDIGTRLENEDRHVITWTNDGLGIHILDGHSGVGAVDACATCLEADVLPRFSVESENSEIVRGLQQISSGKESGCTLSSVYIFGDKKIYASVLGDSPIILMKDDRVTRVPLHEITNKKELKLRLEAGLYQRKGYPNHLFVNHYAGLSCFRGIGDKVFGDKLGREPEFHEFENNYDCVIVASDGLKLNDKELLRALDEDASAQNLIDTNNAILAGYPIDNTTIILITN